MSPRPGRRRARPDRTRKDVERETSSDPAVLEGGELLRRRDEIRRDGLERHARATHAGENGGYRVRRRTDLDALPAAEACRRILTLLRLGRGAELLRDEGVED